METVTAFIAAAWVWVSTAPIERIVIAAVLVAVAAWAFLTLIETLLDFVATLVRGHAPADTSALDDEAVEYLARIREAIPELVGGINDAGTILDRLDDTASEEAAHNGLHRAQVEEYLASILAATRSVRVAVRALDDLDDEDDRPEDPTVADYAIALGLPADTDVDDVLRAQLTPRGWAVAGGATDEHDEQVGTTLHEHAEQAARLTDGELDKLRAELTGRPVDDIPPAAVDPFRKRDAEEG